MSRSLGSKIKDVVFYAPLGVMGFIRDNTPVVLSLIISRGKQDEPTVEAPVYDPELEPTTGKSKRRIAANWNETTSDINFAKNSLYTAVGAFKFLKSNANRFGTMFKESGKKTVNEKTDETKDKVSSKLPVKESKVDASPSIVDQIESAAGTAYHLAGSAVNMSVKTTQSLMNSFIGVFSSDESEKPEDNQTNN